MAVTIKGKAATKASKVKMNGPAGADKVAGVYRDLIRERDQINARIDMAREELMSMVDEHHLDALKCGIAENTITLPTPDGGKVLVIYQERYKGISTENIPDFKQAFGSDYSLFVEETESVALAKNATLAKLKDICGDKYNQVAELLEITQAIQPRKGAFEQIAAAYRREKTEVAEDLMTLVGACITSPQVRT